MDESISGSAPLNPQPAGNSAPSAPDANSYQPTESTSQRSGGQGQQHQSSARQAKPQEQQIDEFRSTYDKQIRQAKTEAEQARQERDALKQQYEYTAQLRQVTDYAYGQYTTNYPGYDEQTYRKWAEQYATEHVGPQHELATYKAKEQAQQEQQNKTKAQAYQQSVAQDTINLYQLTRDEFLSFARDIDITKPGWEHELHVAAHAYAGEKANGQSYGQRIEQRNNTPFLAGNGGGAVVPNPPPNAPMGSSEMGAWLKEGLRQRRL